MRANTQNNLYYNIMQGRENSKWSKGKHDANNRKFSRNEPILIKTVQMLQGSVICILATALK